MKTSVFWGRFHFGAMPIGGFDQVFRLHPQVGGSNCPKGQIAWGCARVNALDNSKRTTTASSHMQSIHSTQPVLPGMETHWPYERELDLSNLARVMLNFSALQTARSGVCGQVVRHGDPFKCESLQPGDFALVEFGAFAAIPGRRYLISATDFKTLIAEAVQTSLGLGQQILGDEDPALNSFDASSVVGMVHAVWRMLP